ncbi:MAG: ATP-binding protein [bacterium]
MAASDNQPLRENLQEVKLALERNLENVDKYLQILRLASIGEMVGEVSHTFNNILGGILGYAQLVRGELTENSDLDRQVKVIEKASKRASKLISQLQFFSNVSSSQRVLDPKLLLEDLALILSSTFNKNIKIVTRFNHGSVKISIDVSRISQALWHLCHNCGEAMPHGGELKLQTRVSEVDQFVIIEISDTGCGIAKRHLRKIFDPFFSTKEGRVVHGLGLSAAQAIVKAHHGKIEVESMENQGTLFRVFLPTTQSAFRTTNKNGKVKKAGNSNRKLILVVEDEPDLRDMAKHILEKRGFRVLVADSGRKAIELFEKNADEIRLVILDMILPEGNGKSVYEKIKKVNRRSKVILTSGYVCTSPYQDLIDDNGDSFLAKPWDVPQLIAEAEHALSEESPV